MSALKKLKALNNKIIFKFLQDTTGGVFHEEGKHGLVVVKKAENQLNAPRWGRVVKIGKDVSEDITPEMYILIESLKWTTHLEFNGEKFWVTNEDSVMIVSDDPPDIA